MKKLYSKIALALSVLLMIVWGIMGTGASLAWFADEDEEVKNIFHFAQFELQVAYRDADGVYRDLDSTTSLFDESALYEPGYVQVVYLRIKNTGTVPFDFKTAVRVTDYTTATNKYGQSFQLQDFLRFGLVTEKTEAALEAQVETRQKAESYGDMPLNNYDTQTAELAAGDTVYMALIVRMPKEVGNEANYLGQAPRVELGLIVAATQKK